LGGDLYAGHKIKNFFLADEIHSIRRVAPRDSVLVRGRVAFTVWITVVY